MSWIGTSPSPLRSDRSSTALIAYSPFAEIRIGQRAVPGSARPGRRRASPIHRLASHGGAPAPRRAAARTTLHKLASHGGAPAPRRAAARTTLHKLASHGGAPAP